MPPLRWLCCVALLPVSQVLAGQVIEQDAPFYPADLLTALPVLAIVLLLLALTVLLAFNKKLRRHNSRLTQQNLLHDAFLQQSDDFIAVLAADLSTNFINPALATLLSTPAGEALSNLPLYVQQDSAQLLLPELDLSTGWQGEGWLQTTNGRLPLSISITAPLPPDARCLLLGRDIATLKQQQQQNSSNVLYDAPSGVYSPVLMTEYLHTLINISNTSHLPFAVMLIRLNQLLQPPGNAPVNDLQNTFLQLANRMSELVSKGCVIARYSTDTLAVLVPQHLCQDNTELQLNRLGHRVLKLAEQTAVTSGCPLQTTIGISVFSADSDSATELILAASAALVEAAKAGHSRIVFADKPLTLRSSEYQAIESELHKAIIQDEFELYFQPRISIGSNRVVSYEALLRWHNPRRGILLPQHFLAIADESGLTVQLDRLAFSGCCSQLQLWQKTGINRGRIALNISNLSLQQSDFVTYLNSQMASFGLTAQMFELELDESALLQSDAAIHSVLLQLAELGFKLTLDNFGEGISSLSVLRQQPLHSVKIAQSYIKEMEHNEQQRNITASLIRLASYLHLDVIACGIENEMQAYLLHVMGCDTLQGHLFSKAIPASDIPALLAKENRLLRKALN